MGKKIVLQEIAKKYDENFILESIDLEIHSNERIGSFCWGPPDRASRLCCG